MFCVCWGLRDPHTWIILWCFLWFPESRYKTTRGGLITQYNLYLISVQGEAVQSWRKVGPASQTPARLPAGGHQSEDVTYRQTSYPAWWRVAMTMEDLGWGDWPVVSRVRRQADQDLAADAGGGMQGDSRSGPTRHPASFPATSPGFLAQVVRQQTQRVYLNRLPAATASTQKKMIFPKKTSFTK